jgi:threonine/homoserine efflux transporter RhtA
MKSKYLLFSGIISLLLGIILRASNQLDNLGLSLIIIGVVCKVIYIIKKVKKGEYKPGIELFGLGLGLLLFFVGLYLDPEHLFLKPVYFIIFGITLKIIFILRFIHIVRSRKTIE